METIYDNLVTIQRSNPKIEISRDKDQITIICKADGKKKVRAILMIPLFLLLIGLLGAIFAPSPQASKGSQISGLMVVLVGFGGVSYSYYTKLFRKEKMVITKNDLQKVDSKNRVQVVSRQSIINIDYMKNKDAIVALTNTLPVMFFRNSDQLLLQKIAYVIKELWFKGK